MAHSDNLNAIWDPSMYQHNFLDDQGLDKVVNVAKVKHRSLFRYPGGKTWLVPRIFQWLSRRKTRQFIEPFCGGGIIGLTVAFEDLADRVTLIEIDPQVAAVWNTIIYGSSSDIESLIKKIVEFEMNRDNVEEILAKQPSNTTDQAFTTILRNRVSHGGCLAQGAGLLRNGENNKGIGSRWYPATIAKRIRDIQTVREKIDFYSEDAIEYIENNPGDKNSVYFIDPPYWVAGTRLYDFAEIDHGRLFSVTANLISDFLMTYDNASEIVGLSERYDFQSRLISMKNKNHAAQRELLIGRDLSWLNG